MSIQLDQRQREAVDYMHSFMRGPASMMVLEGFAGTGKTTCVQTFIEETEAIACLSSPTNKAAKVLRGMAKEHTTKEVDCSTIYSLLGLVLTAEGEIKTISAHGENKAEKYHVIVVDEASMVGENLMRHIESAVSAFHVKIIFMGDPAQLPPVKETHSRVFDLPNKFTLTKVMRHDNQILTLATAIRTCIYEGGSPKLVSDCDDKGGVFCVNGTGFRNQMEKGYVSDTYKNSIDVFKTIAWRNVTVDAHNEFIRGCIYGPSVGPDFQDKERIVACAPVQDLLAKLQKRTEIVLFTDQEATVVGKEVEPHPIYKEILCYKLQLQRDEEDSPLVTAYAVHESSKRQHKELIDRLADNAKRRIGHWSTFWDAKDSFHDIRPCHAITAHRSQGSTYQTVFVNVNDILLNRNRVEALKCLYVAVSRGAKNVVLKMS